MIRPICEDQEMLIQHFMNEAVLESQKSSCVKRKVGCVIVYNGANESHIVGRGYNEPCSHTIACPSDCLSDAGKCISTNHAEMVALHNLADWHELSDINKHYHVFVTTSPCLSCFKELVYAGVGSIYYLEPFGDIELVESLKPIYAPNLILQRVTL